MVKRPKPTGMPQPRLAYITAGAAGMYCGSCMHDNTLARGLSRIGVDVQLIPTYTPIRTDEDNVSIDRVFYGGISVFLEQQLGWYRYVAPLLSPIVDQPWLIRWATRSAGATDPRMLGALTVSMLRGAGGRQKGEAAKLCRWLSDSVHPHLIQFSNILIGGCIPSVKADLRVPIVVTLQGDDVFLESLPDPFRGQAIAEIQRLVKYVDGFLVHSRYYADFMSDYLQIPRNKIHQVPLGIDTTGFSAERAVAPPGRPPTIGYLARLAPEKGFHLLIDAFLELRRHVPDVQLRAAGWIGAHLRTYVDAQFAKLRDAGCDQAFEYVGSVDREGKLAFLRGLDVLSVPTTYCEPKGIFVLEALAAGVPVVQPEHGAFPELVSKLGGGMLVPPDDPHALAEKLGELLEHPALGEKLGEAGQRAVHQHHSAEAIARETWATLEQFLT